MGKLALLLAMPLTISLTLSCYPVNAQEIYKWTDENGKVHFGDRSTAPADSKKISIKAPPPIEPPPVQSKIGKFKAENPQSGATPPAPPNFAATKKSIPVDPAKVGPKCQGLIDQIAKVKRGTPWTALAKEFNQACPGITWECINYQAHPENNTCTWVERTGNDILLTKNFP